MFAAPGFQTTQQLYESDGSIIYRAVREHDRRPVVLKVLKAVRPPPESIARFKREYLLTQELAVPGVIGVFDLVQTENHWVIVTEDFGAESLRRLELAGRISVARLLELGAKLAGILAAIHDRAVIHKDINPSNIVLDPASNVVKIIDFGISTRRLPEESVAFAHPARLEGTPRYMSPEQTGRINRGLDYRTDFYSLGCTLYELLTGRPPFAGEDLIDLIHCHLAHVPTAPHELRPDVPRALSDILLKLLAKDPDDRYQSGRGLAVDLIACSSEPGAAATRFDLGRSDIAPRFRLPARLYGRTEQIDRLLQAFEQASRGRTQLMMVAGYSGIGKSALVKQLYSPITERRGFFVTGKFGQYERNVPYAAVIQAFDALIHQLLCEGEARVAQWRERLLDAIGPSCSALVEVIRPLELIVGSMPPPPTLSPGDAQFRLMRAMTAFVQTFARPAHPLVLFLDDLQWADGGSLDLLKHLTSAEGIPYLLIIGAYRDNEVGPGHPLDLVLRDIAIAERFTLPPLDVAHVAELVADALHVPPASLGALAELIHGKTGGNPFFIGQLLTTLHAGGLIRFDHGAQGWTWDMQAIHALDVSDNVVELVLDNLHKLGPETQELLRWAAFLGSRFDLRALTIVSEQPGARVAEWLVPAISSGFVMPLSGDYRLFEAGVEALEQRVDVGYKFLHDRIQQAAHALTPSGDEQAVHLHIGRRLRGARPDALLDYIHHLNAANALITDPEERLAIAELDQRAGTRAKDAAAYKEALQLFCRGLSFLLPPRDRESDAIVCADENAFGQNYQLSLELTGEATEMAYISGGMADMEMIAASGLEHARSWEDKVKIYQVMIKALTDQGRALEALEKARTILEALGIEMPREPSQADIDEALTEIDQALRGRSVEELAAIPPAASQIHDGAMQILESIHFATFVSKPALGPIVSTRMVQQTMVHGYSNASIYGFLTHGRELCAQGKIEQGIRFGQLARMLCAKMARSEVQLAELNSYGYYHVFHWQEPIRELIKCMNDGYRAGLESGRISVAVNNLFNAVMAPFPAGFELGELVEQMRQTVEVGEQLGQELYVVWLQTYRQCALNLMGDGEDPCVLEGSAFHERKRLPELVARGDQPINVQLIYIFKLMLYCRFGKHREAVAAFVDHIEGQYPRSGVLYPPSVMYYCLARLALCPLQDTPERGAILDDVRRRCNEMKRWAALCSANYAHKYHLVEAELARVEGDLARARDHYDLAIDLARTHQYLNEESLALEHAALCFRQHGRERLAGYYLRDAHYAYRRWGATAKLEDLERRFPDLLADSGAGDRATVDTPHTLTKDELPDLDLQTVLRACRAIRSEREHGRLLQQIMGICLVHAGARRGALILVRGEDLVIKAKGTITDHVEIQLISEALRVTDDVPPSIIQYTARTLETVVLGDASRDERFKHEPYFRANACRSVLCLPILYQGMLVGITYMENNEASDAFQSDRLEILDLVMAQAAVSLENARLRHVDDGAEFGFTVGGSLANDTPSYVLRDTDRELFDRLERGDYCHVFNARQMGKSSLRVHTMARLVDKGVRCAAIDLTAIGTTGLGVEQWYVGIARALLSGLGLRKELDLRHWWKEQALLSPVQRLAELIDGFVLERIEAPMVIFIDEIDMILGLDLGLDDFFALIRFFYNKRADDPRYAKITFVFLGVATPTDLVQDKIRTPFNIGHAVQMKGFRYNEARILTRGLTSFTDPDAVLESILVWADGQPFLTQKLCRLAQQSESRPAPGQERDWVAALVRDRVIDRWRMRDDPEHLKTMEARILRSPNRCALLSHYQQIWQRGGAPATDAPVESELLLSGLVVREWGRLRVANPIYAAVFDAGWIHEPRG